VLNFWVFDEDACAVLIKVYVTLYCIGLNREDAMDRSRWRLEKGDTDD